MKVQIEAEEGELARKAYAFATGLLEQLVAHGPRLAKALDAIEETESPAQQLPVIQALATRASQVYREEMNRLYDDIEQLLLGD